MKILSALLIILISTEIAVGQLGGKRGFEFVNTASDTRLAALGGVNVSLSDWDVNMLFQNPGSLNPQMHGQLSLQYTFYYADIGISKVAYAHEFEKTGTWAWGLHNINYGEIQGYDPVGNQTGELSANETVLVAGNSRRIGNFTLGLSMKFAYSNITGYSASALMFDLGGMFIHPEEDWKAGMNIRNVGFRISDYTGDSNTGIPFDIQIGTSYKPEHMPVRVSITAYNLYQGDLLYYNPSGSFAGEEPNTFHKIFSHFNFGAEIIVNRNFNLRAGYNYLIRRELRLEQKPGGAGFSYGLMFRVKNFEFSYSRAIFHVAGGINFIGIASNLSTYYRKKEIK